MKSIQFDAVIQAGERGGALVELPFDPKVEFGSARAKVVVRFDGHEYRGSLAVMNGVALIGVRKDVRAAIGKGIGDQVKVVVSLDTAPRTVTVPPELARALSEEGLDAAFGAQSYTARREAAEAVSGARKSETRQRRIEKIISGLSAT